MRGGEWGEGRKEGRVGEGRGWMGGGREVDRGMRESEEG